MLPRHLALCLLCTITSTLAASETPIAETAAENQAPPDGSDTKQDRTQRLQTIAESLVRAINAQDCSSIRADFNEGLQKVLPPQKAKDLFAKLAKHYGELGKLDSPHLLAPNRATFRVQGTQRDLNLTVVLDKQNKIVGITYQPAIPVPEKLATSFHLPFEGRWSVCSDGGSKNHKAPTERFALDFIAVDESGKSYDREGKENSDHHSFGRPILAPADGVVTDVITGVRDNTTSAFPPPVQRGKATPPTEPILKKAIQTFIFSIELFPQIGTMYTRTEIH